MTARIDRLIFWSTTIIAVLIVAWDLLNFWSALDRGEPVLGIAGLAIAAAVWLAGYGLRALHPE